MFCSCIFLLLIKWDKKKKKVVICYRVLLKLERALQGRKLANIILYFGKSHMCPLVQTKDVLDTSLSHSLMPSIYNVCCLILLNFCLLVLFVQNKINNIRSPYSTTIIYITELEMCVYSDTDRLNIIIKLVYMKLSLSCPYI